MLKIKQNLSAAEVIHPISNMNNEIFGTQHIIEEFLQSYKAKKIHHAWMIVGPHGTGKLSTAFRLAYFYNVIANDKAFEDYSIANLTTLLSASFASQSIFSNLNSHNIGLHKQFINFAHPGFMYLSSMFQMNSFQSNKSLTEAITIDDIRQINAFLSKTSGNGRYKVVIIDDANHMTYAASNSLLKMLEEPCPDSIFILICHNLSSMLPTVLSRVRKVYFAGLNIENFVKALKQQMDREDLAEYGVNTFCNFDDLEYVKRLFNLSGGSVDIAKQMIALNFDEICEDVEMLLSYKMTKKHYDKLQGMIKKRSQNFELVSKIILYIIKNKLIKKMKDENNSNYAVERGLENFFKVCRILQDTQVMHLEKMQSILSVMGVENL